MFITLFHICWFFTNKTLRRRSFAEAETGDFEGPFISILGSFVYVLQGAVYYLPGITVFFVLLRFELCLQD